MDAVLIEVGALPVMCAVALLLLLCSPDRFACQGVRWKGGWPLPGGEVEVTARMAVSTECELDLFTFRAAVEGQAETVFDIDAVFLFFCGRNQPRFWRFSGRDHSVCRAVPAKCELLCPHDP